MEGNYHLAVRIVRLCGTEEQLMAGAEAEYAATDRLATLDLAFNLPNVPLVGPGRYEFQLFSNDIYIGRAMLNVLQWES